MTLVHKLLQYISCLALRIEVEQLAVRLARQILDELDVVLVLSLVRDVKVGNRGELEPDENGKVVKVFVFRIRRKRGPT